MPPAAPKSHAAKLPHAAATKTDAATKPPPIRTPHKMRFATARSLPRSARSTVHERPRMVRSIRSDPQANGPAPVVTPTVVRAASPRFPQIPGLASWFHTVQNPLGSQNIPVGVQHGSRWGLAR
jgi:hypothetical protein